METNTKRYEVRAVQVLDNGQRMAGEMIASYDSFEAAAAVAKREAHRFARGCCVKDAETSLVDYGVGEKALNLRAGSLTALVLLLGLALGACNATTPAPAVETVGALVNTGSSVASAPVHPTTDFGHAEVVGGADDDDAAPVAAAPVEAPDVAPKAGLVMGTVRQ